MASGANPADVWAEWLLHTRYGGDPKFEQYVRHSVERFRQRVLDNAKLAEGMTLADVGAGDGLVAFGAIDRIGPSLRVILTDVSGPLLEHARQVAAQNGVEGQCRFVTGSAEKLEGLADGSVDVVATRSSLAYVGNKAAALSEFHRVLKPGGRISLAEPINQDEALSIGALGRLIATQPTHPHIEFLRLLHRWKAAQFPSTKEQIWCNSLTNFSERDLVRFAREAGFVEVHLELHIDYRLNPSAEGSPPISWEVFLQIAPHPWSPSTRQILEEQFSVEERRRFEEFMRPQVESSPLWNTTEIMAYLTAVKAERGASAAGAVELQIPM